MAYLSQSELLDHLIAGEQVLVPSAAAASSLRTAFNERQRTQGVESWRSAPVQAWPHYLSSLWSSLIVNGAEDRVLLNAAQEHLLWESVIASQSSASAPSLANADSLSELAASAFLRAAEYEALGQLAAAAHSTDTRIFATWADAFRKRCEAEACLPAALLPAALAKNIAALRLPAVLHLAGFSSFTPSQTTLLDAMRGCGGVVEVHHLTANSSDTPRALEARNPQEELRCVAAAIASAAASDPTARFAILLPNDVTDYGELEAILRSMLAPELLDIGAGHHQAPWSFAQGPPLARQPMAVTAMDIFHLVSGPIPIERASALLLTPYLGESETGDAAARLDAYLRRRHTSLRPELTLPSLADWAQRAGVSLDWPSHLLLHLQRTEPALSNALAQLRSYAAWSEFARDALRAVAWPGPRPPSHHEAQTREAFDAALDTLATLDFAGGRLPFRAWLAKLTWQLDRTSLAATSEAAPIQILSLDDADGIYFDHAFLLRATDANWPVPRQPHPLLPFRLQKSLGMPGTDATRDRDGASAAARDLLSRCRSLTITFACEDADGHLRPSPLLGELKIAVAPADAPNLLATRIPLEYAPDDTPLPSPPATMRGGAKVLQLQAACGFRAFADLRLLAAEPDTTSLGLDAADSGNLLHRTLQTFWKDPRFRDEAMTSRDALRSLPRDERIELLDLAIADAITHLHLQPSSDWDNAYLDVQRRRLRLLLLAWLEQEEQRGPFRILDTEAVQDITVGPLTLSVRLDRLDAVEDSTGSGVFFVDYKTGARVAPAQWDGDRPDDPQLPLYALLPEPGEVKGLAFARIRPGKEMRWQGFQSETGMIPGASGNAVKDMEGTVEEWRMTLTRLAQDFFDGTTDVRPKSLALNCRYCGQRLLCRLDPASLLANPQADDAEDAEVSE